MINSTFKNYASKAHRYEMDMGALAEILMDLTKKMNLDKERLDNMINNNKREIISRFYPTGCRVELVSMEDPYNIKLRPGDRGTVSMVDDAGNIHIDWDNGSCLSAIFGVDKIRKV